MNKRKLHILCLVLCFTLCLGSFSAVAVKSGTLSRVKSFLQTINLLQSADVIYETQFDALDAHIVKHRGEADLTVSQSELLLTRQEGARINLPQEVRIYPNEDTSAVEIPKVGIDFKVKRSDAKRLDIRFCDENGVNLAKINFHNTNAVSVAFRESLDAQATEKVFVDNSPVREYVDIIVHLNHIAKVLDVWVDGEHIVSRKYFANDGKNLTYISAALIARSYQAVSFDSFKVYRAQQSDEDIVNMDCESLEWESFAKEPIDAVTADIKLPSVGEYGSSLTWIGDEGGIISNNGTVMRSPDEDKTVTVKVKIEHGDAEPLYRSYDVTVKKYVEPDFPAVGEEGYLIDASLTDGNKPDAMHIISGKPTHSAEGLNFPEGSEVQCLLDAKQTAYSKPLAYKMTLQGEGMNVSFYDSGDNMGYALKTEDNALYALSRSDAQSEAQWLLIKKGLTDSACTVALDPISGCFSVWYGTDKVVSELLGNTDVVNIYKTTFRQEKGTSALRDYEVYLPILPDDVKVGFDAAYLTEENLTWQDKNAIVEDLELWRKGHAGAAISWISSDEAIITYDGKITRNSDPNHQSSEVTLTATISSGEKFVTKPLKFKVQGGVNDELPEKGEESYKETFDLNSIYTKQDENRNNLVSWEIRKEDGDVRVLGEKLVFHRKDNINEDGGDAIDRATLKFTKSNEPLQGIYAMEFTVRKLNAHTARIRIGGDDEFFSANWYSDGTMLVYYRDTVDAEGDARGVDGFASDEARFTILFNTYEERFSLWLNGKLYLHNKYSRFKGPGGLKYAYIEAMDEDLLKFEWDNIAIYKSKLLSEDRIRLDKERLDLVSVVSPDDTAAEYGYVNRDLNLPTSGYYGSNITWRSLTPGVITDDGALIKGNDFRTAIMEATLSAGEGQHQKTDTKQLEITVAPLTSSNSDVVERDAQMINYESIAMNNGAGNECVGGEYRVIRSLSFPGIGALGSKITWSTSDELHITKAGRVIRPRYDEGDAEVTVTATVTYGESSTSKEFTFIVLADEPFIDPQHMTDAEFFGVYENGTWSVEGKLDYEYEGLEKVRDAAKQNDYVTAKKELLHYMQNVRKSRSTLTRSNRDIRWANAVIDDWSFQGNGTKYAQGDMYMADGETMTENSCSIRVNLIEAGATVSLTVRSWYNESSYAEIARTTAADTKMRPRIELVINDGEVLTVYPTEDVGIRAGEYKKTNFNGDEFLKVQNFGDFESDNLRHAVLKFKFDDLKETDTIRSGQLFLYGRAVPAGCGGKRLYIAAEVSNTWSAQTASYSSFMENIYSFNGLPGGNDWEFQPDADIEYLWQAARLNGWPKVAVEYMVTGNEEYAYKSQRIFENMITNEFGWTCDSTDYEYVPPEEGGLRGAFPRTLDAGLRAQNVANSFDLLIKSRYVTPDYCTAMLKTLWDTADYFTHYNSTGLNWRQYEFESTMAVAKTFPEFIKSYKAEDNWYQFCINDLARQLYYEAQNDSEEDLYSVFPDGSAVESSDGYSLATFNSFVTFKRNAMAMNATLPAEFDDRLHKFAYYQALMMGPDGVGIGMGDSTPGGHRNPGNYSDVIRWYNDPELEFIATGGDSGTEPSYTSVHFPYTAITTMRGSWDKSAPYLVTNARGGGQHGHHDYNTIWLNAYGRILLSDMGIFSYTTDDPYRMWGMSTRAHNTVLINDTSQKDVMGDKRQTQGIVHEFTTNAAFDFLSQTVPESNTPGFNHRRTITYIKPNLFIVSDLMQPNDKTKLNNYKQLWHMLPEAKLEINEENRTVYSNYPTKGNLIIASADADAQTVKELGWYDRSMSAIEDAPFGYFEKSFRVGDTTFDTVLIPNNADKTAKATATKLESEENATAIRVNFTEQNADYTGYYHMDYNEAAQNGGAFGPYETDAQVAYVQENSDGEIVAVMMKNGSYVRRAEGSANILYSPQKVEHIYVDMVTSYTYITGVESEVSQMLLAAPTGYNEKLFLNEVQTNYSVSEGFVRNIGSGTVAPDSDNVVNNPISGVQGTPNAGGDNSGGGGGGGGGSTDNKEPDDKNDTQKEPEKEPDTEITEKTFPDVQNHWAEGHIGDLYSKGIVNGDENGNFNPDNSIKRSEFIAIAVRSAALKMSEYEGSFTDVAENAWYADVIQTALDNGIISSADNFRPDDLITREEMAKIICGIARLSELYDEDVVLSDTYTDAEHISPWAKMYVKYISSSGLMKGREDGTFAPKDGATRAEAAAVISRMLSMQK